VIETLWAGWSIGWFANLIGVGSVVAGWRHGGGMGGRAAVFHTGGGMAGG